ncbi:MAG: succinylglutamate desuccinylase [Deltaproteobacteria bacterium]|nr:MAG: succinylglutamate desuccinylase [Deltaproteobacteria bacterium]
MRSKVVVGLIVALVAVGLVAGFAMAQAKSGAKLLCVSKTTLKGEETVASCLAKGERFAIVDQFGLVRILSPEEIELTKAFNPKAFETRAFGMKYQKLAPVIQPMPVSPEVLD